MSMGLSKSCLSSTLADLLIISCFFYMIFDEVFIRRPRAIFVLLKHFLNSLRWEGHSITPRSEERDRVFFGFTFNRSSAFFAESNLRVDLYFACCSFISPDVRTWTWSSKFFRLLATPFFLKWCFSTAFCTFLSSRSSDHLPYNFFFRIDLLDRYAIKSVTDKCLVVA
jgi:hypothetical protein